MAALPDLSPCSYLPVVADHILAVGWLDRDSEFATGPTLPEVFTCLHDFARHPWQPFIFMGTHECNLCQFQGEKSSATNLFIPRAGKIYVCPELITHYINVHFYSPPAEFCAAVLACPPMDSMEYKQLLIACNGRVLWEAPPVQL